MARGPRIDYPGARHHVFNRSARKEPLFHTDDHCMVFMRAVADLPDRCGVRVHGYALMPNHYHLMLECPQGNLSRAMKVFSGDLTRGLNALVGTWDGPVMKGRFKNRVVEHEDYWTHLLLYLHLNPVKANLVRLPGDSRWTSHHAYAGLSQTPSWLTTSELLDHLGGRDGYLDALQQTRSGSRSAPESFDEGRLWVKGGSSAPAVAPPPDHALPTADQALAQVAGLADLTVDHLLVTVQGRGGNPTRRVAAWWLTRCAGLTHAQAGARLGASTAQVANWCSAINRGKSKHPEQKRLVSELLGKSIKP